MTSDSNWKPITRGATNQIFNNTTHEHAFHKIIAEANANIGDDNDDDNNNNDNKNDEMSLS